MESSNRESKENNKENESAKLNPIIDNLKSDYFLQKLYDNIRKKKKLEIVKYNKKIKNRLNLSIKEYKEYSETYSSIEIEIIPAKGKYGEFINIDKNDILYYHIFFNENKKEIKNKYYIKVDIFGVRKHEYYIDEEDKVTKIKIIIDFQVKSFKELFYERKCIESINFKKFYRNNITNMSDMFRRCSSLKELNLTNFKTDNVTDMNHMFSGCSSLKELYLINFNTNNVTNMSGMFSGCSSLKELKLTNFNNNNVTDMSSMFSNCSSLKELNLTNFNTNNVTNMSFMFLGCSSLKELNLINFNTNNVFDMSYMFRGCSDDLKRKIKSENKNIKDKAFLGL